MEALLNALDEMPHGRIVGAIGLAALVVQIVTLELARRRRGRLWVAFADGSARPLTEIPHAFRLHAVAAAALLALPVAAAMVVYVSRTTVLAAFESLDPSEKAGALSRGISGQLNGIAFGAATTITGVALWLAGVAQTVTSRASFLGVRSFPPAAVVGLGLLSIAVGVLQWTTHLIHTFASIAGVPPDMKVTLLNAGLDFARTHLELFARMSSYTIVGLTALAAVLTVHERKEERTASSTNRRTLLVSGAVLLVSAVLVLVARPMRAENDLPWPAPARGDNLRVVDPTTPDVVGPDLVERAPVVQLFLDRLGLDGSEVSIDDLESKLVTLRNYFGLLRPGVPFNRCALIVVDGRTPIPRLLPVLRTIHDAGYDRPRFAFTRAERIVRPTLGELTRVRATAARVTLIDAYDKEAGLDEEEDDGSDRSDDGGDDGGDSDDRAGGGGKASRLVLSPDEFAGYDPLARRIVAARRLGNIVLLDLGKPPRDPGAR